MTKMIWMLLGAMLPMQMAAQNETGADVYNDSTEYIVVQQMVTDTMAIRASLKPYREKWANRLDSMKRMKYAMEYIHEHSGRNFPKELVPDYRMFLAWFRDERCKDGDRYTFSDGRSEIIDFANAEQQIEKGKITKQIVALSGRVGFGQISSLEYDLRLDDVDAYQRVISSKLPEKPIGVSIRNPRYRPDLFIEARDEKMSNWISGRLGGLDYSIMNRGWEWLDEGGWEEHKETYPVLFYYKKHSQHPEYKVIYLGTNNLKQVCDQNGNLVYTEGPRRTDYGEVNDLVKYLIQLECRKDYEANMYNVKQEGPEVHYAIKYGLGYFSDKGKHPYKLFNATASKYIEQLQSNHWNDFKYLYEIKRIGNTAFLYRFVTYDMEPKFDVYVSYYNTAPFSFGKQIDKIVTY